MFDRLFKPRPAAEKGRALYLSMIRQARRPEFYAELGVADSGEGRFELYALHLALLLRRLKRQGPEAEEVSQTLFEAFVNGLDDGLREMGVSDVGIGRKMRKLGEAAYGRVKGYDAALDGRDDLEALVRRTAFSGREDAEAARLADYARRSDAVLAATTTAEVMAGETAWPTI